MQMHNAFIVVMDYLRCIRILREFSDEDETIEGVLVLCKAVERVVMDNGCCFKEFLEFISKYRVKIAERHCGSIPIAYYLERWLNNDDFEELK